MVALLASEVEEEVRVLALTFILALIPAMLVEGEVVTFIPADEIADMGAMEVMEATMLTPSTLDFVEWVVESEARCRFWGWAQPWGLAKSWAASLPIGAKPTAAASGCTVDSGFWSSNRNTTRTSSSPLHGDPGRTGYKGDQWCCT